MDIKIIPHDRFNPREDHHITRIWAWHKRYMIGDADTPKEVTMPTGVVVKPLYLLDHSGLRLRTRDFKDCDPQEWDSGQIGWVFISHEDARKEFKRKRVGNKLLQTIRNILEIEVGEYDKYLAGVPEWGYQVYDKYGDVVDSCYGFDTIPDAQNSMFEFLKSITTEEEWA